MALAQGSRTRRTIVRGVHMNRRDFLQTVAVATAGGALVREGGAAVRGVQLGAQTYSFRDMALAAAVDAMATLGIETCELWAGHLRQADKEPPTVEDARKAKALFDQAGVGLHAFNGQFSPKATDEELANTFELARVLGVTLVTTSTKVSLASRIGPLAEKADMVVGFHNHSRIGNDETATPADFARAQQLGGDAIKINLDIGHFVAANLDPVAFLEEHHADVIALHIKDRKRDQGDNVPFGEGDTPITEVLQAVRDGGWPIHANIEYEYKGTDTVTEVRRCLDYCRKALES
ncbi:MAG: TIM barrel protein [Luteitalea sp.]|nr:TIM barrel protein [Luteitalea sp.]